MSPDRPDASDPMIEVTKAVSIPESELRFTTTRSSGPGGQNVNKVETRVTLWFDVRGSQSLSPEQKGRVLRRLGTRINKEGVLRVVSQKTRNQAANRHLAVQRFIELLRAALRPRPARKKTDVPPAARQRRLEEKGIAGRKKRRRGEKISPESWET